MRIKMHWDRQAGKGELSGTQDRIAKQLEIQTISNFVKDGMRVLDVGCGDGETLIQLSRQFAITGTGIDFSQEMIEIANNKASKCEFVCEDIKNLDIYSGLPHFLYDLIYTERTLINLPTWEEQRQAIIDIGTLLKPGGVYLMCECFTEGIEDVNLLRQSVGLEPIIPPWHNHYLRSAQVHHDITATGKLVLENRIDYSANYYFLSRVVNAYVAAQSAVAIDYDSPINRLALHLPNKIVNIQGQGQLWVWRKQ